MKNILFLSLMNGAPWGGSEELWYQTALHLGKKGISTGVCCYDWPEKQDRLENLVKAGCELYRLPGKLYSKNKLLSNHRLKNILDNIPFEDFEHVVINQGGWKEIVHGPFKQLHKRLKDFILVYHNYNIHDRISSGKKTALETWVNAARKNLGDALRIFSVLRDNYQLNIPRTERLFNPITFDSPARPMPYPGLINGKYQFAMLAALDTERKAQDILVRSLTGEKWKDRNWELHLYGEGKDKKSLQQLTKHFKLENRIHIHGNAKNYLEAISLSHLVLQITHIDAMPITVMEAMAVAKPVVISSVGDMPLWVTENENGWVSKEVNTECIDKTLDKAWQHRENWEAMGKKSFERFRRDFPSDPIEHFLKQINER